MEECFDVTHHAMAPFEDAPKTAPNTKKGASDYWECDVNDCSMTGINHNEGRYNAVPDLDAEPWLLP